MSGYLPGSFEPKNRTPEQQSNELNKNLRILNDTMCCVAERSGSTPEQHSRYELATMSVSSPPKGILGMGLVKSILTPDRYFPPLGVVDLFYNDITLGRFGEVIVKSNSDHSRRIYSAFTVTPAASATDIFEFRDHSGLSLDEIIVNRVIVSGTQTTPGVVLFNFFARDASATGGTYTDIDSYDASEGGVGPLAVTAPTLRVYTANPTLTATYSNLVYAARIPIGGSASPTIVEFPGGLRLATGSNDIFAINLNGQTIAGGSLSFTIEYILR